MARKQHKPRVTESGSLLVATSLEATRAKKPRYNGFACGHGVHGDTKYNRAREKQRWVKEVG